MNSPVIVWFRLDLRLADNPALVAAVDTGCPVIPLFIWSPDEAGNWPPGSASRYWLHHALTGLNSELETKNSRLVLRPGPSLAALKKLIRESGADKVYWNRCYEPAAIARDMQIKQALREQGITVNSFNSHLLYEPHTIKNRQGGPFKVFTPFWKHYQTLEINEPLKSPEARLLAPKKWPPSEKADSPGLLPKIKWYITIAETWNMSGAGAIHNLRAFLRKAIQEYPTDRDYPALQGISRISPYLHFGQISARQIWHLVYEHEHKQGRITPSKAAQAYLRQLIWREFAFHLLFHFPHTPDQPLHEKYKQFPWQKNRKYLTAWQNGQTGYPIVDAGMRELWHTGWMHNRVRMITGSFLVKDLLIHWREGAKWFWETLVDADLANNTLGWQWVAGCGADAAPYFRIFNPVTQGEKFDPDGVYVKRWVPELSGLDKKYIHKPWQAPAETLKQAGITLGKTYPHPLVDHAEARNKALAYYQQIKNGK
jgi:deoxyribodipyrimidine photo-lyase